MPRLSRWYIRTALIYLLASFAVGIFQPAWPLWGSLLWPTYWHLLVVGWLTQLIFGVAFWMFPRQSALTPRGSEWLGWTGYWLLNAGLLFRVVGEPAQTLGLPAEWLLLLAASFQLIAAWTFVINTWSRVKER